MKRSVLLLLLLGCETGSPSRSELPSPPTPTVRIPTPTVPPKQEAPINDGGVDATPDASADAGCEPIGPVVGHCVTHQATACVEYFSDHSVECNTSPHLVTGWFPGKCGDDEFSDLHRSNGGCMNLCGQILYNYPFGGVMPTEKTRATFKQFCEESGQTYIEVP